MSNRSQTNSKKRNLQQRKDEEEEVNNKGEGEEDEEKDPPTKKKSRPNKFIKVYEVLHLYWSRLKKEKNKAVSAQQAFKIVCCAQDNAHKLPLNHTHTHTNRPDKETKPPSALVCYPSINEQPWSHTHSVMTPRRLVDSHRCSLLLCRPRP